MVAAPKDGPSLTVSLGLLRLEVWPLGLLRPFLLLLPLEISTAFAASLNLLNRHRCSMLLPLFVRRVDNCID